MIRRFDGCKLSPRDDRDWTLCSTGLATQEMVEDTNYPDYFMIDIPQDIYNQGSQPTCVAFSLATIKEIQDKIENAPFEEKRCSTAFIYANREEGDWQGEGMYPRQALKQLQKIGTCAYSEFPINKNYADSCKALAQLKNLETIKHNAKLRSISAYYKINTLNELKYTLMNVGPVLISIPSFGQTYWNKNGDGWLEMGPKSARNGAHAMIVLGWRDDNELIIQNSWGKEWGDEGLCYLNFDFYEIYEMWAITDQTTEEIRHYWNCKADIHEYDDWQIEQEVTCIQDRIKVRKCVHCGYEERQIKSKTDVHDFEDWICINPKTGLYKRKCKNCVKIEYETREPEKKQWIKALVDFLKGLLVLFQKKGGNSK